VWCLVTGVLYQRRVQSSGLNLELRTENSYEVKSARLLFLWSFILNVFSASSVSLQIVVHTSISRKKEKQYAIAPIRKMREKRKLKKV